MVFETDQLLQEALDLTKVDSSPYAVIIEDIKLQLKMWFSKQNVVVCRHNTNSVAHELAKMVVYVCQLIASARLLLYYPK